MCSSFFEIPTGTHSKFDFYLQNKSRGYKDASSSNGRTIGTNFTLQLFFKHTHTRMHTHTHTTFTRCINMFF